MNRKYTTKLGQRFARLIVEAGPFHRPGGMWFSCRCDCGKIIPVLQPNLHNGRVRSCGCYNRDQVGTRSRTHGDTGSPEYSTWGHMLLRGRGIEHRHRYFDRGIRVCARWEKYKNFLSDMGRRPSPRHSLDRKDNNKGYSPTNCRWATCREQCNNTRRNIYVTVKGTTMTLTQWSRRLRINPQTLHARYDKGERYPILFAALHYGRQTSSQPKEI